MVPVVLSATRTKGCNDGIGNDKSASGVGSGLATRRSNDRWIIYVVRRTQLFLDDQLREALHARARSEKTTISELVRQAARERYLGGQDARMAAMQGLVGIRKSRARAARLDRVGDR